MTTCFVLDETETLVCKRIYFEALTMIKQLLGGLDLRKPANWLLARPRRAGVAVDVVGAAGTRH